MIVAAGLDHDLDLDPPEERRVRVEHEPVCPRCRVGELPDAAVAVGLAEADELISVIELDAHAAGRDATAGVEDMRRDHSANLQELARRLAVLAGDLGLVGAYEPPVADDLVAGDVE